MISLGIFGIDSAVLAIVALLTGAGLVALAMWLAGLISPRSFNPQKGEAYECGIPTRGVSMTRFNVGILFLHTRRCVLIVRRGKWEPLRR